MEKSHCHVMEPEVMSLQLLKSITDNFSREIGRGAYGKVYKAVLENGEEIAVKLLDPMPVQNDREQFVEELTNLWKLRHQNIIRLVGYCYEIKHDVQIFCGKPVIAENAYKALCFEYMHNGSLGRHIYDASYGHDWQTRYKIIKGICEGLKYLHEGLDSPMFHLDLKPENILLDKNMVPKLADFGLSKLVDNNKTQVTKDCVGTTGYIPPEYIDDKLVSDKFDIYSLGVVMTRIIAGYKGYSLETPPQDIIRLVSNFLIPKDPHIYSVYQNWRNNLQASGCTTLKAQCHQVKRCIEIASDCRHKDRRMRPKIGDIVSWFEELEPPILDLRAAPSQLQRITIAEGAGHCSSEIRSLGLSELLDVYRTSSSSLVSVTNRTEQCVVVWIRPNALDKDFSSPALTTTPIFQVMDPHSSWVKDIDIIGIRDKEPEVVMVAIGSDEGLVQLRSLIGMRLVMNSDIFKRIDQLGGEVHRAVLLGSSSCEELIHEQKYVQAVPTTSGSKITCADVHPTESLILMLIGGESLSIFNYATRETLLEYDTTEYSFSSVKFIAREQWFLAADEHGCAYVYDYTANKVVTAFQAYSDGYCISSLAVHPTDPLLLTASSGSGLIKLWNWEQNWKCTHKFDHDGVQHLSVNLRDTNTFVSASNDKGMVWNILSGQGFEFKMSAPTSFVCTDSDRHFLVSRSYTRAKIWDLESREVVHNFCGDERVVDVTCHATLPILAIRTQNNLWLWDASTYRLAIDITLKERPLLGMVFTGTEDLKRLVVPCEKGVQIFEIIKLPTLDSY